MIDEVRKEVRETEDHETSSFAIRRQVIIGSLLMLILTATIGIWAAKAELTGAVIAAGQVVVAQNVKKVQHRDGGIVNHLNVKNGDQVRSGDVILRLDNTQLRAEFGIITNQIAELTIRSARLEAEISGYENLRLPEGFETENESALNALSAERQLLKDAHTHQSGKKAQLNLQIDQLGEEIAGLKAEQNAKAHQVELITRELDKIRQLYEKNLTSVTRLYAIEREQKKLEGEQGSLVARIARTNHKISETRLTIALMEEELQLEAQKERRAVEARIAELREKQIILQDKLSRTDLKAPQSGRVHELAVHTIGGVITPAETLMLIVPDDDPLRIDVQIAPKDIDQIAVKSQARLRFSAFNQQATPELMGHVTHLAPDVTTDERTGLRYYSANITIDEGQKQMLPSAALRPGMPVEAFISTGERTALSYFLKPITDQIARAMREE